jgi:hypothetical protein
LNLLLFSPGNRELRPAMSYCSNGKMRFQSFFMLITTQPCFFALW